MLEGMEWCSSTHKLDNFSFQVRKNIIFLVFVLFFFLDIYGVYRVIYMYEYYNPVTELCNIKTVSFYIVCFCLYFQIVSSFVLETELYQRNVLYIQRCLGLYLLSYLPNFISSTE